jgi:hypothetical protein
MAARLVSREQQSPSVPGRVRASSSRPTRFLSTRVVLAGVWIGVAFASPHQAKTPERQPN